MDESTEMRGERAIKIGSRAALKVQIREKRRELGGFAHLIAYMVHIDI
jgi:hypothetical protein